MDLNNPSHFNEIEKFPMAKVDLYIPTFVVPVDHSQMSSTKYVN